MPGLHNIEWKSTWKDEYLKWICGFANAQGRRIYSGMDDRDHVVGLPGYQKLLEDIFYMVETALAGLVEAWDRGIAKVQAVCQTQGYPEPRFEVLGEDMTVTFVAEGQGDSVQASGNKHERIRQEILAYCVEARSLGEISAKLGLRHLSYLRKVYIKPFLGSSLGMTHPENPRHKHQRYRTIVSDDKQNG